MKRYSRLLLLLCILFSVGFQVTNAGFMNVGQKRNEIWVMDHDLLSTATAETSVKADIQVAWECDYDTEVAVGIWSVTDGYYVEHVPGTVSGDGSKRYMLQYWVPAVNGVHKYRVEAQYRDRVDEEWNMAYDGVVDFEVEVTGGEASNPIESILGEMKMPQISGFSIPELPGFVWGLVGLLVGAGSVYLFMRDY